MVKNIRKRMLALVMAATFLFSPVGETAYASESSLTFEDGSENGSELIFDLDEDGTAVIDEEDITEDGLYIDDQIPMEEDEQELITLETEVDGVTVMLSSKDGSLDGVASIQAERASLSEQNLYELALQETNASAKVAFLVDVTLYDENGNETEPSGNVAVSMSGIPVEEALSEKEAGGDVSVLHVTDEMGRVREVSDVDEGAMELLSATAAASDTVVFNTDSFSQYALVLTGNDSQVEVEVASGETWFEMDKYLSDPTGEMNGQNTYDVYLEQAYYDDETPMFIENPAPVRQNVILVLDQSASMSDGIRVPAMNESTEVFLTRIRNINLNRIAQAEAGNYTDIDPDGDVMAQMEDHLMYVTGIVGYNNRTYTKYRTTNGSAMVGSGELERMISDAYIEDDYAEWVRDYPNNNSYDLQDCTRTDLGMQQAEQWVNQTGNAENTSVVLMTDGAPYGYGDPGNVTYYYESIEGTMWSVQSANDALTASRNMKNDGVTVYAVYLCYQDPDDLAGAFASGDIRDVQSLLPEHMTSVFLSLCSSDFPKNGRFDYSGPLPGHITFPVVTDNATTRYENDPRNFFGKYIYLPEEVGQMAEDVVTIPDRIDGTASANKKGYFGPTSRIHDEISDPFDITDRTNIRVYMVPRIPVNIGPDGIPTDMDDQGYVTEFRWGEQYIEDGDTIDTEWVDITDEPGIAISVQNNTVEVTGFDYEANAVTDYDKDMYKTNWTDVDSRVYEPGDYGYKLIVVIPINAKVTFGGNHIETNNSYTSYFIPADPVNYQQDDPLGDDYLPFWRDNTDLNPDGNLYIEKYPVPYTDLAINYRVVSDDMTIYAPQTAELENLVTDANGSLFYTDPQYSSLQTIRDNAYTAYQNASDAYNTAQAAVRDADPDDPGYDDLMKALGDALIAHAEAQAEYMEAQKNFEQVESYIPDGINNAFVNIHYSLRDPDNRIVGTLDIPHGTPYVVRDDGTTNLNWNFTETNITKSGEYTITCTVTPVNTNRAPGGHISTELDDESVQEAYPYDSTEYSPTGSSENGTYDSVEITANPQAHIFQLKITASDTRRDHQQSIDFAEGNENLQSISNIHIIDYEWVCTDGVTQSNPADEPGTTGSLMVGGGVTVTSQIPDLAWDDGLVEDISGTTTVMGEDGEYVPVGVILSRNTGNLNKSASDTEQVTQVNRYMDDDDNLYGNGVSSVIWEHECMIEDNCDGMEFAEAVDRYSTDNTETGKIRYLIHILANPVPSVGKTTTTPGITRGQDIEWSVNLVNDKEADNRNHRSSDSTMIDVLPYVGDARRDQNTGREGSDFSGQVYLKTVNVDYSQSADALAAYRAGSHTLYYTTDTAARTADETQLLGTAMTGNVTWHEARGTLNGTTVAFTGIPSNATAIRLDTVIEWLGEVTVNMTANIVNLSDQQAGDYYHNDAWVMNGNGIYKSEVVATEVTNLYVSGTVWEDTDNNGLMSAMEPRLEDIVITLYKPYDSRNPGGVDRTVNGVQLVRAHNTSGDTFAPVLTPADGTFLFDDIPAGTYYVVADYIPDEYDMTAQRAGAGDPVDSTLDSEAEPNLVTGQDASLEKVAWIREITVNSAGVPNQNIGLKSIRGTIRVGKTLDEIYFPVAFSDEEKAEYKLNFVFHLRNTGTGEVYTQTVTMDETNIHADRGGAQVWAEFTDLPLGTYVLTEEASAQYEIEGIETTHASIRYNDNTKEITIPVTSGEFEFTLTVNNTCKPVSPPGGSQGGVQNWIGMRIPVSLEVTYVGADPISSTYLTEYTFDANDFAPGRGGDIIVTYDDGSTISLSEGTLRFDQLTLTPATVTNRMNSGNDRIPITVSYAEKGRTVKDSFRVAVDLKPIYKFQINFDANGSSFNDNSVRNVVMFAYDDQIGQNYITSGVYKDVANGGLRGRGTGYTFAGWNTRPDGLGTQYDGLMALNAIGAAGSNGTSIIPGGTILLAALPNQKSTWYLR